MASQAHVESRGGGGVFGTLCVLIIIVVLVKPLFAGPVLDGATASSTTNYQLGGVQIQERTDNHVVDKHGVKARDVLNRPGTREYWYSASRETVMVAKCDANTCACSFIAARGLPWGQQAFQPFWLDGQLELTTYFMSLNAKIEACRRDAYIPLGIW